MPKINQQLLDRLKANLGGGPPRIYAIIAKKASEALLDRHLAALVVASENDINIQKYSTPQERAQIRGTLRTGPSDALPTPHLDATPEQASGRKARTRKVPRTIKAKDNSVFVV